MMKANATGVTNDNYITAHHKHNTHGNDGTEYIEEDKFYDGDGCYDFTLSVTNVNLGDDHSTSFTVTNSWEFSWESGSSAEERNSYPTC